jgi:protein involved in polysaccharide export with SLBB domain
MRKFLFFGLLVIVLVSLSWFRELLAQDMSNLSDDQKQQLLKLYKSKRGGQAESGDVYKTPEIFEDTTVLKSAAIEEESAENENPLNVHRQIATNAVVTDKKQMTAFEELKPFGFGLFDGAGESEPPVDIAATTDYVLGPGDNLLMYLWGRVEKEFNLTVDREGKIFVPQVGEIVSWGLTLEQFKSRVEKHFSKVYSDFSLTVSLGKIRSIRIYVTGEVQRPGAYTVSSLTSLFNAIYTAGGPNERGSMRSIKLMRAGKSEAIVDLYRFLLQGDNSVDVRLQTGDLIFVPVAGTRVAVRGEIKRPALYELVGDETALDLLELAGQPTPEAHLDRVMLERVSGRAEWEVIDLNLNQKTADEINDMPLKDGDRVTVYSVYDLKKNMVAIAGHVKHPGYYERNDSTKVSDLIMRGQFQPYDVYFKRADLFRRHANNRTEIIPIELKAALDGDEKNDLTLRDLDSLHIYSINEVEWDRNVYIEGEVKRPGIYQLYDGMKVEDLVFLAGSFKRSADRHEAEIARMDTEGSVTIVTVDLNSGQDRQILLEQDDQLYIRRIPEWKEERAVEIEGEVKYPGQYTLINNTETLYDLLNRAGGFTERAFPQGLVFERASIERNLDRLKVDKLIERSQPIVEDTLGNRYREQVFEYDPTSMNRIVIDVDNLIKSGGSKGDITLEPSDRIFVPTIPSGVSIMGAVGANGTMQYVKNKKARHFIKLAGDFTRQADKGEIRLIKANGQVYSGGSAMNQHVDLGDMIVVPTKIEKKSSWFKSLTTAVSAATGILTSAYIISKL